MSGKDSGKSELRESLGFRRNGVEPRLRRLHPSYSEASLSLSSDGTNSHPNRIVQHSKKLLPANSSNLIWQSIIQHVCSIYEQDPARRKQLFVSICSSLSKMNLMSNNFMLDELSPLRSHYQHAFAKLIKVAQGTLDGNMQPLSGSKLPLQGLPSMFLGDDTYLYHHSRYCTEFEELAFLAKGGFGSVYKVRNRLDDAEYAIKKIVLKHRLSEIFVKILREVTTLAQLSHPNIVNYKTAWLEPYLETSKQLDDDDGSSGSSHSPEISISNEGCEPKKLFKRSPDDLEDESFSKDDINFCDNDDNDDDDDNSWGVVFEDDFEIDETDHRGGGKKRRPTKKILDEKLIRCKITEVDENDFDEDELPCIVGQAATPPQATYQKQAAARKKVFGKIKSPIREEPRRSKRQVEKPKGPGSKFWIGSSSEISSPSTSTNPKSSRTTFSSVERQRKVTSVVPIDGTAYWSHRLIEEQDRKLQLLFNSSLPLGEIREPPIQVPANPSHDKAILFIQMQLCERTLRTWLDDRNEKIQEKVCTLSHDDNVSIFKQILSGVAYIHSKGIIHRDLKPRNIFIDAQNRVQIGDFGLAKKDFFNDGPVPQSPADTSCGDHHPTLQRKQSQHTSGVGTQAYAAPEQLTEGLIDYKSDMYSLGIVLFELYNVFTTTMERTYAITNLRNGAAAAEGSKTSIPTDLVEKYPTISKTILRLTQSDPNLRPGAAQLLSSQEFASNNNSDDVFLKLEDENQILKDKVKLLESQLNIQVELNRQQQQKIETLEKLLTSNLIVGL